MTSRLLTLLLCTVFIVPAFAAEKADKKQASEEEIRARLRDHALKKRAAKTAAAAPASRVEASPESVVSSVEQNPPAKEIAKAPATPASVDSKSDSAAKDDDTTVLPEMHVRKDRITELDKQVAKQNREIRREKQNTKPTALDETLNGPKASKWLSIFGGQSSDDRANIARERVAMMEDERDLIEAIAQTQDPVEKEQLQRTLDAMRAMRRDLEAALR